MQSRMPGETRSKEKKMKELVKNETGQKIRQQYVYLPEEKARLKKRRGTDKIEYFCASGRLLPESYSRQIGCLRLKKEIAWCQRKISHNEAPDMNSGRFWS